uniref:Uncharacterized protein n=1 Tax=Vespula pensylvanica TaxID=30213 RepID=A0A834PFR5_VESPE|nr:hypothetical protein H0235_001226 [Vespula pensylvanica]
MPHQGHRYPLTRAHEQRPVFVTVSISKRRWLAKRLVGWLLAWLVGWLVACLVGWLVVWLVVVELARVEIKCPAWLERPVSEARASAFSST